MFLLGLAHKYLVDNINVYYMQNVKKGQSMFPNGHGKLCSTVFVCLSIWGGGCLFWLFFKLPLLGWFFVFNHPSGHKVKIIA